MSLYSSIKITEIKERKRKKTKNLGKERVRERGNEIAKKNNLLLGEYEVYRGESKGRWPHCVPASQSSVIADSNLHGR